MEKMILKLNVAACILTPHTEIHQDCIQHVHLLDIPRQPTCMKLQVH